MDNTNLTTYGFKTSTDLRIIRILENGDLPDTLSTNCTIGILAVARILTSLIPMASNAAPNLCVCVCGRERERERERARERE